MPLRSMVIARMVEVAVVSCLSARGTFRDRRASIGRGGRSGARDRGLGTAQWQRAVHVAFIRDEAVPRTARNSNLRDSFRSVLPASVHGMHGQVPGAGPWPN